MGTNKLDTILLIDGNKRDRECWAQRLNISAPKYVVLEADTGALGLAICHSQRIDCVVVELDLPDMPGFQVLLDLVRNVQYPEKAVIILTRLSLELLAELSRKNGAMAYLVKSRISGEHLHMAIRRAIS